MNPLPEGIRRVLAISNYLIKGDRLWNEIRNISLLVSTSDIFIFITSKMPLIAIGVD